METKFDSPYIGLQPYKVDHQRYFFGRARDSRIISSNLFATPLTVFYGASGVGKSSALQAGVIPLLLKSPRTAVVSFQRWPEKDPVKILKDECLSAIHAAGYKDVQVDMSLDFDEFLFQAANAFHGTIVIILDQFEEYFLYHRDAESTFDAEFARAVNRDEIDANFLIALREDSLSMLDRFNTRIPNMLGNSLRLRHLDETSAREAICKPLEVYNQEHPDMSPVSIEPELVDALIKDVRAGKLSLGQTGSGGVQDQDNSDRSEIRIEAPFLQLILTRLWKEEMRQGSSVLQLGTLNTLGGASNIVRTHLDNAMSEQPSEYQEIAANIFRFLVTPSGTKIAYTVKDLAYYAGIPIQGLGPVLDELAGDLRILRRFTLPGQEKDPRYEIYHDVLAPAVLDWRARYLKNKELSQELAKAQANALNQLRSLLKPALKGAGVDIIWMVIGGVATALNGIGFVLAVIPWGGFSFTKGLRKVPAPPLTKKQNNKIIFQWGFTRLLLAGIGYFMIDQSFYNEGFIAGILITIGLLVFFFSGPIGGLLAYRRIRRKENQSPAAVPSQPNTVMPSS